MKVEIKEIQLSDGTLGLALLLPDGTTKDEIDEFKVMWTRMFEARAEPHSLFGLPVELVDDIPIGKIKFGRSLL